MNESERLLSARERKPVYGMALGAHPHLSEVQRPSCSILFIFVSSQTTGEASISRMTAILDLNDMIGI